MPSTRAFVRCGNKLQQYVSLFQKSTAGLSATVHANELSMFRPLSYLPRLVPRHHRPPRNEFHEVLSAECLKLCQVTPPPPSLFSPLLVSSSSAPSSSSSSSSRNIPFCSPTPYSSCVLCAVCCIAGRSPAPPSTPGRCRALRVFRREQLLRWTCLAQACIGNTSDVAVLSITNRLSTTGGCHAKVGRV